MSPEIKPKRTLSDLRDCKGTAERLVFMSVPDFTSARWAEAAGVDVLCVGDSLAMVAHGHPTTIPATMDMMILHATAVRRGAPHTFILGSLPYQTYNTIDRALSNAARFMQEASCDAVQPQCGRDQIHILKALVVAGIPTASQVGLTPHTVAMLGGFKVQGKSAAAAMKLLDDALAAEEAGCFMIELEAVPPRIAKVITEELQILVIGIGAGPGTDGQLLICYDLLGMYTEFKPKFTKRYASIGDIATQAIAKYGEEVRAGVFPDAEHSYQDDDQEYEMFCAMVEKRRNMI